MVPICVWAGIYTGTFGDVQCPPGVALSARLVPILHAFGAARGSPVRTRARVS